MADEATLLGVAEIDVRARVDKFDADLASAQRRAEQFTNAVGGNVTDSMAKFQRQTDNAGASTSKFEKQIAALQAQVDQLTRSLQDQVAANDNFRASMDAANDNVKQTAAGLHISGIEALTLANHMKQVALAAYVLSPAFREAVNPVAITAARTAVQTLGPSVVGVAGMIMSALAPAMSFLASIAVPILAIVAAFKLLVAVIDLGSQKIAEFNKLAADAANAGVSTDFWQRQVKGATDFGLEVGVAEAAMKKLGSATEEALGGSSLETRLHALEKAGNFANNLGAAELRSAVSAEDKYKAVTALITEAMAKGERLAALDLAAKVFPPEMVQRLRADNDLLAELQRKAADVKPADLISDKQIANAIELKERYDAAMKTITDSLLPVFTDVGLLLQRVWVFFLEKIANAITGLEKLIELMQAVAKLAPSLPGSNNPQIGAAQLGVILPDIPETTGKSQTQSLKEANEQLGVMLRNHANVQKAMRDTNAIATKVYGDLSKDTKDSRDEFDRLVAAQERHAASLKAEGETVGLSIGQQAKLRTEYTLTQAFQQALTRDATLKWDDYKEKVDQVAESVGKFSQALSEAQLKNRIQFEAKTAGFSQTDVQVAQQLSKTYGDMWENLMKGADAQAIRANIATKDIKTTIDSIQQQTASLQAEAATSGMAAGPAAAYKAVWDAIVSARIKGIALGAEQIAVLQKEAEVLGKAADATARKTIADQNAFEAATMFLSATDKQIATSLKPAFGLDVSAALNSNIASLMRFNSILKETADQTATFASGFIKDLANGAKPLQALEDGVKRLAESLIDIATKQIVNNIFKGFAQSLPETATLTASASTASATLAAGGEAAGAAIVAAATTAATTLGIGGTASATAVAAGGTEAGAATAVGGTTGGAALAAGGAAAGTAIWGPIALLLAAVATVGAMAFGSSNSQKKQAATDAAMRGFNFTSNAIIASQRGDSLQSQLTRFDVQAQQQRIEEMRAGGQAMAQLEHKLAVDRANIIQDFNEKAEAAEKDRLEKVAARTQTFQDRLFQTINDTSTLAGALGDFDRKAAEERAQEVKDGGEAINDLEAALGAERFAIIKKFDDDSVKHAQEIASRQAGFVDQLFTAMQDQSTLSGQLAVFDLQAERDRENEVQKGGEALLQLEAVQSQQRYNIIKSYNAQIIQAQQAAEQQRLDIINRAAANILNYVNGLLMGPQSTFSPQARLNQAQATYNAQLALAQTGNADALGRITSDADNLVKALRDFYGSSGTFQNSQQTIINQLLSLPAISQATDPVVAALRDTILPAINSTTTAVNQVPVAVRQTTDQVSDLSDTTTAQKATIDLIRGYTLATTDNTASANSLQNTANSVANVQQALLGDIKSLNDSSRAQLELLNDQLSGGSVTFQTGSHYDPNLRTLVANSATVNNNMITALNKIVINTASAATSLNGMAQHVWVPKDNSGTDSGVTRGPTGVLHTGGWVPGLGDTTILAQGGEYMLNRMASNDNATFLPALNSGEFTIPALVSAVRSGSGPGDRSLIQALLGQVGMLREEMFRNRLAIVAMAEHLREPLDDIRGDMDEQVSEFKLARQSAA